MQVLHNACQSGHAKIRYNNNRLWEIYIGWISANSNLPKNSSVTEFEGFNYLAVKEVGAEHKPAYGQDLEICQVDRKLVRGTVEAIN